MSRGDSQEDFRSRTIIWGGGHSLSRAIERHKNPAGVERVIKTSTETEPAKKGRSAIWGCVDGERTKIIVRPVGAADLFVVTVIGTGERCT